MSCLEGMRGQCLKDSLVQTPGTGSEVVYLGSYA